MKYRGIAIWAFLGVMIVACSKKTEVLTTESGIAMTFVDRGDSVGFVEQNLVILNMLIETEDGKVILNSNEEGQPRVLQYVKEQWEKEGLFYEALGQCGVGDSVSFSVSAYDFFFKTFKAPVPDSIDGDSQMKFTLGIENSMSVKDYTAYIEEKQVTKDAKVIEDFLSENNITAEKTESGLCYVISEQGTGPQPQTGETVVVHYRGAFMDDTEFDSSFGRDKPFEFPLGQGRVIKGWDEGIALLNVGSKATFYIPSALAYGTRGAPGAIPPNSVLKFDVELLEIK